MLRMGGEQRNTRLAYSRVIFAALTGVLLLAAGCGGMQPASTW